MSASQVITYVDERRLVDLISAASHRVVYMAPGVSESVADVLAMAWERLGPRAVTVILDADPEVCRLGFGTLEGLRRAFLAAGRVGTEVCQQSGLRVGLVISDDTTIVYSPTPLLIEAAAQPQRPNAVALQTTPPEVEMEVGLGDRPAERTVGRESVTKPDIVTAQADLVFSPRNS